MTVADFLTFSDNESQNQIRNDFPDVSADEVASTLHANKNFYAPTFFALRQRIKDGSLRSTVDISKAPIRTCHGKGKQQDAEFERELDWVIEKVKQCATSTPQQETEDFDDGEVAESAEGQQCGCCFSSFLAVSV